LTPQNAPELFNWNLRISKNRKMQKLISSITFQDSKTLILIRIKQDFCVSIYCTAIDNKNNYCVARGATQGRLIDNNQQ
jgi:hypothetical protein